MNETIEKEILSNVALQDYISGKSYFSGYVKCLGEAKIDAKKEFLFSVESQRTLEKYICNIRIDYLGKVDHLSCTCNQFRINNSCKHLGACFFKYKDKLFKVDDKYKLTNITDEIFSKFTKKNTIKEEVNLELELYSKHEKNGNYVIEVKPKIGIEKLYSLKSAKLNHIKNMDKYNDFIVEFGKLFTYDPNKHYFNKIDLEILDFLQNKTRYTKNKNSYYYDYNSNPNFEYINQESIDLLNLLKKKEYILNNKKIVNIVNDYPINIELKKTNDNYELDFNFDNTSILTNDFSFIQKENTLYKINSSQAELFSMLNKNNIKRLIFDKNKIDDFSKSILPIIKSNLLIDKNITEIVIPDCPDVKLYFDLYLNKIICNVKFNYDFNEIDYFDYNNEILRDEEIEEEVINTLISYKFIIRDRKVIMENTDDIGEFLENNLLKLNEKYETFTSKKLKQINVIKKSNITSTFSIGKDNIMSYNFNFDNISNEEINKVLSSLKSKKKYFHLKNGNLINLEENDNLKQLNKLYKEMELTDSDLINGSGIIPKYRAIYLDSLKSSKYNIIKTDNLFDNLISRFKTYKNLDISLNNSDLKLLRDYQRTGIKWLYNIHKTGFGGILADEMGLGKSIQTIYFIKQLLKENNSSKFLIVSPTSLAYNWEREFDKFGNELNYKVIVGNRNIRRQIFDNLRNTNILITTYGLLREDKEYYDKINFTSIIIDEAQNIKNPTTEITKTVKSIKAESMFALTGTPLENSVIELWSIFDFIMPGFLSNLDKFKAKYKVKEFDEETNKLLGNLNKEIAPFILRRKKIDVMKELPEKQENNIFIDLSPAQKKLYVAELDRVNKEIDKALETDGIGKVRFMILQLLTKLRQICIDPRIIFENYNDGSEKMDNLIKIIKEVTNNGHKVLLFTSFKTALDLVKNELDKNNLTSYTIDGSVSSKKRMELVDKFNSDNTNVFLIMLKAGGTGLNLTSADIVIHLDLWWNPQAENQATDRAHRIGQKNKVEVIKLITKGTIEEKILNLQEKKKTLSDKLIESNDRDTNLISNLSEDDLKDLLSFENNEN